jgi:hypothetical protein
MQGKLAKIRPSWIVAGVLVLFTLGSILFSGRPVFGYSAYVIEEEMVLPENGPHPDWLRFQTTVGEMPWPNGRSRPSLAGTTNPIKIGHVYNEYGILGMPYWASPDSEMGLFLYSEQETHIGGTPVDPDRLHFVEEAAGVSIPREQGARWYKHIWGWLFPILLAIWLFLWRREDRKREAEHWGDESA